MANDPSGWMPDVEQIRTNEWGYPDVAEDNMYPQAVVNHVMQGYQRTMLDWAHNGNAGKSAHFTVGRDGRIVQHVSIWDPAWHAGDVNTPTTPLFSRYGGGNPNKWAVGIEQEGFSINPGYGYDYIYDTGHPWPNALIESVIRIHKFVFSAGQWLIDAQDKPDRVLTHSMLNSKSRAQDPGDLWLATVRPRILAALTIQPAPTPVPTPPPPIPTPAPPDPTADYKRGWTDHYTATVASLESIKEPWE